MRKGAEKILRCFLGKPKETKETNALKEIPRLWSREAQNFIGAFLQDVLPGAKNAGGGNNPLAIYSTSD